MGARKQRPTFGAGSHARRHQQAYQALTGAIVMGLAIATLTLHHFGFSLALVLALCAAALCVVARVRAVATVYLTGAALLAGVFIMPPQYAQTLQAPAAAPAAYPIPMDGGYEMYVLGEPPLPEAMEPAPRLHVQPEAWRPPMPGKAAPQLYET